MQIKNKRNASIDIAKAIGILLMIVGHCSENISMSLRHFIYSFHMPLFFIISGFLFKRKDFKTSLSHDTKHLLAPYFVTCGFFILLYLVLGLRYNMLDPFYFYVSATLWGSGTEHSCMWLSDVPVIGAIWFLPALFVCKNTYNLIAKYNQRKRLIYSSIICLSATIIGRYILFIPFSILSGLSAILFFAIGDFYKRLQTKIKLWHWIIGISCWYISFYFSNIDLAEPRIDLYFIDIIGATTATYCVVLLSKSLTHIDRFYILSWIGQNSLYILCFHLIDLQLHISILLYEYGNWIIIIRILIPILCTITLKKGLKVTFSFINYIRSNIRNNE